MSYLPNSVLGSPNKNYLSNGNFPINTTASGWAVFKTTLTSLIPTGSIGAADAGFSISSSSSSPLAGAYSGVLASTGVLAAGNGLISDVFTIDAEDQAKVLTISFYYSAVSGTMNFSGTSANTWQIYVYDVTNAAWIQPAGVYNLTQSSGAGLASATFQTTSNSTQYRLALICVNATSGAVSLKLDDLQLGPQKVVYGAPVTDWVSYTPGTTNVTTSTSTGRWRRVGNSMQIQGYIVFSAAATGTIAISLPTGYSIDTTQLTRTSFGVLGTAKFVDISTSLSYEGTAIQFSSTNSFSFTGQATVQWNSTTPVATATGDEIEFIATVPISGWSSTVQMSNDTDTRVVAARYTHSTNQACPALGALTFDTKVIDTHSAFSVTNYLVPISGIYEIKFYGASTGSPFGAATQAHPIYLGIDGGVAQAFAAYVADAAGTTYEVLSGSTIAQVRAGQTLQIIAGNNGIPYTLTNLQVEFKRLSGPSAIAASETVAMRAYKNTGAHTNNGNNQTVASYNASPFDTHGAFNITTGEYTVPVSGTYLVAGTIGFSPNATGVRALQIEVDLSRKLGGEVRTADGANVNTLNFSGLVTAIAGQKITVSTFQNSGGNLNYDTTSNFNSLSIVRVGN